jgi:hypothetical protein
VIVLDDLRSYFQMASGLTDATTAKAKDAVAGLLATGLSLTSKAVPNIPGAAPAGDMMNQVQELADDLVATSRNNREMLVAMIRSEVDKAVGRMGFVREDELAALRRHVQRLDKQVTDLEASVAAAPVVVVDETVIEEVAPAVVDEAVVEVAVQLDSTAEAIDEPAADPVTEDVPKTKKKIYLDDGA